MPKVNAIVLREFGDPVEVTQVESVDLPAPAAGEAQVRLLAAPINPADLNILEGKYGNLPDLPAVIGNEGVGEIVALGPGTTGLKVGTRVLIRHGLGTWRESLNAPIEKLAPVSSELPVEQAAMLMINPPTAWRMLHDFVNLKKGDWVVQNAANSGVGRSVIAICRQLSLRSVNLVRRAELIEELQEAGADEVIVEGPEAAAQVRALIGSAGARLGLNAVGGESALRVASALGDGGIHVTYGAMGRQPVRVPNGLLIFRDISFRGFWVSRWFAHSGAEEREAMFSQLSDLVKSGQLHVKIAATYPLTEAKAAIAHASQGERGGKILFVQK